MACACLRTDGQKTPPAYNLANVTVPTALYAGTKDDLDVLEEVFPEALRNSEAST